MKKSVNDCPLCFDCNTQEYSQDKYRAYIICRQCQLIFVPRNQMISADREKHRYESHQNDENDPSYQNYLKQIVNQIMPYLHLGQGGLDFGCGRTDLMAQIFRSQNILVDSYDLYFLSNQDIWQKKYNFIILSEVIEHLRGPLSEMQKIRDRLTVHGQIFIKTKLYPNEKVLFDDWFYKRDNTHVQFFNLASLQALAKILNMNGPEVIGEDLFVLKS